jgi:hypothetical protein
MKTHDHAAAASVTGHPAQGNAAAAAGAIAERAPRGRQLDQLLASEQLQAIRAQHELSSELIGHLRGMQVNSVLLTQLVKLDVNGQFTYSFHVPMGSVFCQNHTGTDATIAAAPPQASAPGQGTALNRVPAGGWAVVNLLSRDLTIYGTPNGYLSVQVFSKPQPPQAGPGGLPVRPGAAYDTIGTAGVGAAGSAVIPALPGLTAYATGFELTWRENGVGTVADTLTLAPTATSFGSQQWNVVSIAGAGGQLIVAFPHPIAASGQNQALSLALTGVASRAAATINLHGFYL